MKQMEPFNFDAPAEVFAGGRGRRSGKSMVYRRFDTGSEAVRFVVEVLAEDRRGNAVIETDEVRFDAAAIQRLYASDAYPLQRRAP
jgi:hypothetical protein